MSAYILGMSTCWDKQIFCSNSHKWHVAVDAAGLLVFLKQGFGGGTDFETPLQRAFDLIAEQPNYLKADVLMISDGDCQLSPDFLAKLQNKKQTLNCMVYSVLCAGDRVEDEFSDEVVVIS